MSDRRRKGLLPGELEQMKREELSQKRRFRLLQVREQSKEVASDIRKSVKKEKAKQLEKLKEDLLREKQEEKENALQNLKQQYYENVSEIGSGWRAAQNQALIQEEQRVKTHLNNIAANERGQQALAEYWKENALKKESSKSAFQARKFALEVEKERAAYIASLPPPKPDPVDTLLQSSGKIKGVPDQKIMRTDINVEKANPEEEPDACEAAQLETDKQQQMESEKAKLQQKRGVQMKSRFREAWKKKVLDEEYSRTLKDIEDEERLARNEARQKYYSDENRYFMCSPLDKQIRKEKQAKAEDAFQKHFRAERDYEDNFDGEYSFHMIEKTEENAEITDYVEPLMRKPCTSLLETDFEEIDSCDDLVDELNIAYIESPEQKEAPKKLSEVEALSTLLVKLRKRRAELREEGERTLQLCLGVKSTEAGKLEEEEDEILLPKSVGIQAGKVSPPISTGIQIVPLKETDVQERLPSSTQEVQTDTQRKDTYVEAAVQADADFERHTVGSVTTVTTKESSSSTSYMSLPSQYGIPQFERLTQTECDICDVELSQTLQASKGKYEPSLVKQGTFAQPDVSRITSPFQDTVLPKITETKVTHSTATKSTSEFYHSEISSESLASYMKHIMRKYVPAGSDERGSETEVKTVFPPVDFLSTVKYVEPFSVVSPGKFAPSPDSEVPKIPTVISSPPDQLQTPDTYISKPIQTQMEEEQHGVSDQVLLDRDDSFASNLHVQSVAGKDICKGTVASADETYNQLVLTQKMLLSQFHDTSSVDRDEAMAKELQECLLNLNIFNSRPPVKIHRVVPGEILMGHELSTIQEIDSLANGSSTGGLQNLSKSDIMSSSGIFQPLTPVSHLDSSVADHSAHLGESHDLSKSDIVSSSGTFQPLTPVSHLDSSVADHSRHLGQSHDLSIADIVSSSGTFQPLTPVSHLDSSVADHSRHLGQSHDLSIADIVSSSGTFQPLTPVSHLDSSVVDHSRHLGQSHDLSKADIVSSSGTFQPLTPVSHLDSSVVDHSRHLGQSHDLHKSDIVSSSGTFQPLTPVSHLDSSVADHSRHLGQSHDLHKSDIVSSSGTFQPLTPVSHLDSSVADHSRHLGQSHDLHKSDIVSSSGTFQPLTPVSHLDSSVVDHSRHLRESHDLRLFPQTRPAQLYDVETMSQKDKKRQLPYSVSGSTESFQPMSPASWQASTDETKSDDSLSFVPSSSGPLHSLTVTEAENSHVATHMPATSDVALIHPVETVVVKSEIIQTAERTKQVYSSKISDADTSAVTFHLLSSDHDSSLRSAQISVEKDDSEVSKFLCTQKLEVLQQADSTGSPLHPVVSSESGSEHSPAHSVRGIEYGETSSGPFQLISLKTDSSVDAKTLHSHSKWILHADTSSGSFQLMSATVEDSQVSSHTLPKVIVSDHSVPAMSIILEGNEQNHFGSSLQSHLASTKIQHPSVSGILTSTKRDGGELLASIAESPIIHDPQFSRVSLFHKPSTSDSGGSFHQTTSRLDSNVSSFMAASNLKTEPDQVAERKKIGKYSSPAAQSVSLPSSPQKVTKMGKPLEANDQYGNFNQGSQPPNWAKMVLRRNTSSSSGSISSSQESLISAFTESKITQQSTPVKAREVAVQGAGILEEPDLTLIGSEISCSLNVTPKKLPEVADDTLTEGSIASSSSFQSTAQEMPCSSVESLEQKRDPDSRSEVGHLSTVSDNMRTPVSDYSVVTSPVSASLLSFEKHEIEYAESDEGSSSVPPCSTHVEVHKELSNKNFSASSHRTASNFSQGPSSESSTPTTGTPKLYQQKSYTDYRSRTKRLWNNLAEVREKKLAEEKKQAFVKNREKVKELQMKIQKARKTATPKK